MTEKQYKCPKCGHDLIYDYEIDNKDVFYCTECEKRVMALKGGKRYKRLVSSIDYYYCIDTNDDKGLTEEDMLNRLNEQDKLIIELRAEVEVHKHPLFSTRQAEEKIERYENDLRMCREKALYWRNKAEDIFGDMRTNVELKRENEQLKQTIKGVYEILSIDVDVFSDKATEHDINAYVELRELDNKDAYYIAKGTKKAMELLKKVIIE